jgi:hypothetical protein
MGIIIAFKVLQNIIIMKVNKDCSRLRGPMVGVFAIRRKVQELKPGQENGFIIAIKIRSTPSFGGEIEPETSCLGFNGTC